MCFNPFRHFVKGISYSSPINNAYSFPRGIRMLRKTQIRNVTACLLVSKASSRGFVSPNISTSSILGVQLQKLKHALDQDLALLLCILFRKLATRPIIPSPLLAILLLVLTR